MAKSRIELTGSYAEIATGEVTITIDTEGEGTVFFDEASNDVTAYKSHPSAGEQFVQNEAKSTFAKATGSGWFVVVDGVL